MFTILLYFISISFFSCQSVCNSSASLSVTIRINGFAHGFISCCIIEEGADFIDNLGVICANKMNSAAGESFRTLSGITHHEDWLAKAWGFFLYAARVSENDVGFAHQMDELQILERFDEEKVRTGEVFTKHLMDWLAYVWIEVHWIDEVNIGIFF